jgi:hypothetical protein
VHPELGEYLDRFLEEAAVRSIVVDTSGINLDIVDEQLTALDGSAACGLAHVYGRSFPNVRLSRVCWDLFSPEHKETLMFHELGHALLDRPHFDADLPVGSPVSMMNSNSSRVYNIFTLFKREYYINELFGVATNIPFWAEAKTQSDTLFYYGVGEGAQPWTVSTDFVSDGGATTHVISNDENNYAYRINIPEAAKGSSLRLTIIIQKDELPRAGSSIDFAVDMRVENFIGVMPRLLMTASSISSLQTIHSGSNIPDHVKNITTTDYHTISITPVDYFVVDTDYIRAEVIISGECTGTVWLDNFTIIERY